MTHRIRNSFKLIGESWKILMMDKEMLIFPILSALTNIIITGGLAYLGYMAGLIDLSGTVHHDQDVIIMTLVMILLTLIMHIIMNFYNAGLTTCALIRLCGSDPVLADGFKMAWSRLPQILTWSVITATVKLLTRFIKKRGGMLQNLIGGMLRNLIGSTLEYAWKVASFFAISVIVAEEKGARDAIKQSISLVKKNWGEAATLQAGASILTIPVIATIPVAIGFTAKIESPELSVALVIASIVFCLIAMTFIKTLESITKAALYMYAVGQVMPKHFDRTVLALVQLSPHSPQRLDISLEGKVKRS